MKLVDITKTVNKALDNAAKGRKAQLAKAAKSRKYHADKTADLLALELLGFKFVKQFKDGTCVGKKSKKGATHSLTGTKLSSLIEPLKKWPKPPKVLAPAGRDPIGTQVDTLRPDDQSWHPPLPEGATWLEYSNSHGSIMCPIADLHMFRDYRGGKLRFGKLRYNEDFVSMMPGEEGNVTYWKDGRTAFSEGKDPASLKNAAKAAQAAQERKAAGLPVATAAAFKAQSERRKAAPGPRPGDVAGKIQNGVRKPGAGGKTDRIWCICDGLLKELGRTPTKAEVWAKALAGDKETSAGMMGTNYSYWRRFYGHA